MKKTKNKTIHLYELAQYKHVKFLISLEKQALLAYNFVCLKLIKEIKSLMKTERLAKSDDDLKRGWTGEVPKIEVDLDELLTPVIEKHLKALEYALLGKYAGKEAEEAAIAVGLKGKIEAGTVPAAYLQSLDAHRQHYTDLFDKTAPEVPKALMKDSMSQIVKKAERFYDQLAIEFKTKIISTVEDTVQSVNFKNTNQVHTETRNAAPEVESESALEEASERVVPQIKIKDLTKELTAAVSSFENRLDTAARANQAMASAVGTHQSMLEIYGRETDHLRVVNIEMQDEKVCGFCHKISKKPDGSWIYYSIDELKPSGHNFTKKRDQWEASISPQHHRCRCQSVYVPTGFEVDSSGSLRSVK